MIFNVSSFDIFRFNLSITGCCFFVAYVQQAANKQQKQQIIHHILHLLKVQQFHQSGACVMLFVLLRTLRIKKICHKPHRLEVSAISSGRGFCHFFCFASQASQQKNRQNPHRLEVSAISSGRGFCHFFCFASQASQQKKPPKPASLTVLFLNSIKTKKIVQNRPTRQTSCINIFFPPTAHYYYVLRVFFPPTTHSSKIVYTIYCSYKAFI